MRARAVNRDEEEEEEVEEEEEEEIAPPAPVPQPPRRTAREVLAARDAKMRQFYMGVDVTNYTPRERRILQRRLRQEYEVKNEPSFWNRQIKVSIKRINTVVLFLAVCIIGLALYVICSNWGNLDPGFFLGSGLVLMLFGLVLALLALLGRYGVKKRIPPGTYFQRDKVLPIYLLFLLAALFAEAYLLSYTVEAHTEFQAAEDAIHTLSQQGTSNLDAAPYSDIEMAVAQKFNSFYFGAATSCVLTNYIWFWTWITQHCSEGLQSARCLSCTDSSITSCYADAYSCYSSQSGNTQACPYALCRLSILSYMKNVLMPFNWTLVAIVVISSIVMIWTIMLLLYRKRGDVNLATALVASGTLDALQVEQVNAESSGNPNRENPFLNDNSADGNQVAGGGGQMPLGGDIEYAYREPPPHYDQVMSSELSIEGDGSSSRESLGINEYRP